MNDSHQFDFILNSMYNTIGNNSNLKCLQLDESHIEFSKCWSFILPELIHSHKQEMNPYVDLLNRLIQDSHQKHLCSCKTTLCMSIFIWKQLNTMFCLPNDEFNVDLIIKMMKIILAEAVNSLKLNSNVVKQLSIVSNNDQKIMRLKSRHFSNEENDINFSNNEEFYKKLLCGLTRNNQAMSNLIWNVLIFHGNHNSKLNLKNILITTPEANNFKRQIKSLNEGFSSLNSFDYSIHDGIILETDETLIRQLVKVLTNNSQTINAILIDSSLEHKFVHLGYNKELKSKTLIQNENALRKASDYDTWLSLFKRNILNNQLNALFVSGTIDYNLKHWLNEVCSILTIDNLNHNTFELLKVYFNRSALVYIDDFNPNYLFKLKVNRLDSNENNYIQLINDQSEDSHRITSIMLKSRLRQLTKMYEEELRHCLKRVENVLNDQVYIDGLAEEFMAEEIMKQKQVFENFNDEHDDPSVYYELVKSSLSYAFSDYSKLINNNVISGDDSAIEYQFDDLKSKLQAWNTAVKINCLFLNIDHAHNC